MGREDGLEVVSITLKVQTCHLKPNKAQDEIRELQVDQKLLTKSPTKPNEAPKMSKKSAFSKK